MLSTRFPTASFVVINARHCVSFSSVASDKPSVSDPKTLNDLYSDSNSDFDNIRDNEARSLDRYEAVKDLSKMREWHKCLLHDKVTPPDQFKWQKERWALKERYAKYGRESGVDPGVLWMTDDELTDKKIEEHEYDPHIAETIQLFKERNKAKEDARVARMKFVEENLKTYPSLMKEHLAKQRSKKEAIVAAEQTRLKRLKEVRESFGYDIEESDPRFKVKLMMKEEEEKTVSRQEKKKEKQAKLLERMRAMTASLSAQTQDSELAAATATAEEPSSKETTSPIKS